MNNKSFSLITYSFALAGKGVGLVMTNIYVSKTFTSDSWNNVNQQKKRKMRVKRCCKKYLQELLHHCFCTIFSELTKKRVSTQENGCKRDQEFP